MKKNISRFSANKILLTLLIITFLFFILGVLFPAFLSNSDKKIIAHSLDNFFLGISKNKLNYVDALFSSLSINIILVFLVWFLGISIIGIFLTFLILIIKSFITGFSFSNLVIVYGFRGIIMAIIYIIPLIINLFLFFFLCYYSISFSLMLFNYLFRKKEYNCRLAAIRYFKILICVVFLVIFSSLVEIFFVPNIIKIFL